MAMETLQIRLPKKTVETIDGWVEKGIYPSRSEAIRAMVRKDIIGRMRGIIPNDGKDSVQEVREIRKKMSKELKSWEDVKKLNELIK